jgi:hypothetical protein
MSYKFSIKASDLIHLTNVINSISGQELEKAMADKMAGVSIVRWIGKQDKLVDELKQANKALLDLMDGGLAISKRFNEELDKDEVIKAQLKVINEGEGSEDEKKAARVELLKEPNVRLNAELKAYEEVNKFDEVQKAEIPVLIESDERFDLLKVLFENLAVSRFTFGLAPEDLHSMSQSQKELARKIVSSIIGKLDEAVKS